MTNSARSLKLGFLSPHNPYDRRSFSGTTFFAAQALAQNPDIDLRILGNHRPPSFYDRFLKRSEGNFTLSEHDCDGLDAVIGLVATPLLQDLIRIRPDLPFLHVTDATPTFLRDVYGWRVPAGADARETFVASRATCTVYSSHCMAMRAPDDLRLPDLRAKTAFFGINMESLPQDIPQKPGLDRLDLLFVGTDWIRKGGDIAVATLNSLRTGGHNAHLTVVGNCPSQHRDNPNITCVGFLNKNRPADARRMAKLYADAHLLLLPSRGDCTPMVVAEAMAHGTPVVATHTGGISELLGGSGAGHLMPMFSSAQSWAEAILDATANDTGYALLSEASFDRAHAALTWTRWSESVTDHLLEAVRKVAPAEAA